MLAHRPGMTVVKWKKEGRHPGRATGAIRQLCHVMKFGL
jgi:hypothetical protein